MLDEQEATDDFDPELESDVDEIFDIADWENAGEKTDWSIYPFEFKQMYFHLRKAEKIISELREMRMQSFLKGWMSE